MRCPPSFQRYYKIIQRLLFLLFLQQRQVLYAHSIRLLL